jgi:hypothetical protein
MNITPQSSPEDVGADWHDLADQLTPEQTAKLWQAERDAPVIARLSGSKWSYRSVDGDEWERELLARARGYATDNLNSALIGDVPLPPGAESGDAWRESDLQPYRMIWGARRGIDGHRARVGTAAFQFADGTIDDGSQVGPQACISTTGTASLPPRRPVSCWLCLASASPRSKRGFGDDTSCRE